MSACSSTLAGSPVFVASDRGTPVANRASPRAPDERYEGEKNLADQKHGAGTLIFSPKKNGRIEKIEAEWDTHYSLCKPHCVGLAKLAYQ